MTDNKKSSSTAPETTAVKPVTKNDPIKTNKASGQQQQNKKLNKSPGSKVEQQSGLQRGQVPSDQLIDRKG